MKLTIPNLSTEKTVVILSTIFSLISIYLSFRMNAIVVYGDAESHLNIAKRVTDSLTPGLSQLGGIWLPLPHLLMVPFTKVNFLWHTGLAGSIVSAFAYITTCLFLYKFTSELTYKKSAGIIAFLIFALNPNILYMQTTPMTEIVLICFFTLSTYYFWRFLSHNGSYLSLIMAGFFGFLASLSRYDGWFLILIEGLTIILYYLFKKSSLRIIESRIILFSTLAFFGVFLWLVWDAMILGDPLYFSHSQFSANTQQQGWLNRGELLTYHNLPLSTLYYLTVVKDNVGIVISSLAVVSLTIYLISGLRKKSLPSLLIILVFSTPLLFNILTLFIGQSVIFTPELTPANFQWHLFNVRYGILMVPMAAFLMGYLYSLIKRRFITKAAFFVLLLLQVAAFNPLLQPPVTLADGLNGLSAEKKPDAQVWLSKNYDHGLVLLDDYSRTISIIGSHIPMQDVIYVGNKPYWDESLKDPERYATWIVMQKDDEVWKNIYDNPAVQARMYKYFQKVYTSPDILIFKRAS